jgi:carnosine synthase
VSRLVDLCIATAQAFGLVRGVLHIEGKCTSRGPRIVEVNARMGGGRIHQFVQAVWGVDLIEAHLRSMLDLPPNLAPSRKPLAAVIDRFEYAASPGRLVALPIDDRPRKGVEELIVDVDAEVGSEVVGPEAVFASLLAEVIVIGKDMKAARAAMAEALREPPVIIAEDKAG